METLVVHGGAGVDPQTGAVVEPIIMSTTFERDPDGGHSRGYFYSKAGNPNQSSLERTVATLERGAGGVAYASGSAAVLAALSIAGQGGHVLVPDDVFQGTIRLLRLSLSRWGIRFSTVDMTDSAAVRTALEPDTRLVWAEGLSNPLLKVTDIAQVAEIAHEHGALCAVDNTFVTPVFQQPVRAGADFVLHSATKYLAGHADVLAGVLVVAETSLLDQLRTLQWIEGATPSPFDCWLTARGLKTLPVRMHAHADHAAEVAAFLEQHPAIDWVRYPGRPSHPQHELAKEVMSGFGGILSFTIRGGADIATRVAARTRYFVNATSFGAPESLIQHVASAPTHGSGHLPDNVLRLSVGLEHPDDLIADLDQALDVVTQRA
ncbi:trans-sulfuration enzyme family protein [Kribbella capetownensis]|uniref:trans-sulfuration enzyme family protein n=1 Tax=Kribbella capetownensis TaxID=1572659 RepID=UPI00192DAE0A|nr:aminotransferase class I/II-fold pyridoxal phosphate-dependent enzyme [Kribbella capetownensis]